MDGTIAGASSVGVSPLLENAGEPSAAFRLPSNRSLAHMSPDNNLFQYSNREAAQ